MTEDVTQDPTRRRMPIERMNALTDGVFAIVLTLLVLELKLPEGDESILQLLSDNGHVFVAWLISFAAIARFWLVHHAVTAGMEHAHNRTLQINFVVLGAITLLPFSADIIGTEKISEPWSTVVFAVNIGLVSASIGLLARHTERRTHLLHDLDALPRIGRHRRTHLYVLPVVTAAAAGLAFAHPYLSIVLLTGEFVFFAWVSRRD